MNASNGALILTAPTLDTEVAAPDELVANRHDADAAPEDDVLYDPADDLKPPPKPVDGPAIPSTTHVVASG